MAELEIHHESGHAADPTGQKVGVLAAVMAVALAIATIASHRTHTAAVVLKTEANDEWSYYQSKRIKYHNLELGLDLLSALPPGAQAKTIAGRYEQEKQRYEREAKEVQRQAREKGQESALAERRALRYDFGEGLLEIALVLTSLYFISRKLMLPAVGSVTGIIGAVVALTGLLL